MNLYHDTDKALEIEEMLVKKFNEDSEDRSDVVHLSDTGYCPLKTWCRLMGMPPLPFNKTAIGKMTIGKVGQRIIQELYPEEFCEVEHPDLPSHADVMENGKVPIEIKYSAQRIFRAADVPFGWRFQLMGYMALHNSQIGYLLIMNLFSGQWMSFKMTMTEEELEIHRTFLFKFEKEELRSAKEEDWKILISLIKDIFENDDERYKKCKYCDYREGRNRKKLSLGPGCPLYKKPLPN